jgi:hypothetical protein
MSGFDSSYYAVLGGDQPTRKRAHTQDRLENTQQNMQQQHFNNNVPENNITHGTQKKKTRKKKKQSDCMLKINFECLFTLLVEDLTTMHNQLPQQYASAQQLASQDIFDEESTNDSNYSLDLEQDDMEELSEVY